MVRKDKKLSSAVSEAEQMLDAARNLEAVIGGGVSREERERPLLAHRISTMPDRLIPVLETLVDSAKASMDASETS